MYAIVNNELISSSKALIHISDLSIHRGYGIFDFIKIHDGHAFFLEDYLNRFWHSAEVMRLPIPLDRKKITQNIYKLVEKNALKESGVKLVLTGGYSQDGYQPGRPNLIMTHHALSLPGMEQVEKGIKIITHEYVRDIPEAKTINYTMGIWLGNKVREAGAADVLYVKHGIASEFPRCNFFIVKKDNTVLTPRENVLHGITRKNVLMLGAEDFRSAEGTVTLNDIYDAKEAFLTSTTKRIIPIVQVNDHRVGDGKPGVVSLSLLEKLKALEEQDQEQHAYPKKFYGF